MIRRTCVCCPVEFEVPYPSDPKKFCSKSCAGRTHVRERGGHAGANSPSWRGGVSKHPLYATWIAMKQRCLNPNEARYADYGGRGITVCPQWLSSFEQFLADVGEKPSPELSIDRINNNGNYEPNNVRWATKSQQSANRRRYANSQQQRTCPECGEGFWVKNPSRPNVYCSKPCAGRVRARNRGFNVGPIGAPYVRPPRKAPIRKPRKKAAT